jgi:hypothetical protein
MLKPYNSDFNYNKIHFDNCQKLCGLSYFRLLKLSGFLGCGSDALLTHSLTGKYPKVLIKVRCKIGITLHRQLNIRNRSIKNMLFKMPLKYQGKKVGLKIFINQLYYLKKEGVLKIYVEAYRDPGEAILKIANPIWTGYNIWHRFGFTMIESSKLEFEERILKKYNLPQMRFHDFLKIPINNSYGLNKSGMEIWTAEGFTWIGEFDLKSGSENHGLFDAYKIRKLYN